MIRKIVEIDQEKCTGCGLCASACHEGAIGMIDGKAVLLRDDYCDGLGACLPACPVDAIRIIEREAAAFDEAAVEANQKAKEKEKTVSCGCAGMQVKEFAKKEEGNAVEVPSQLAQWPIQIQLVPPKAPYFENADLLVAADCTAYAYGNFHHQFMKEKITIIGCPKLDAVEYTEKLTMIFKENTIRSITLTRMEVPCCGGLERAVRMAAENSGKQIPIEVVTISADGRIL